MRRARRPATRDERGIALLIVLLAITLLTIVVIEFTDAAQVETHLALSARNALQATYLARSGVNVAEALVIGLPDPIYGRSTAALLVTRAPTQPADLTGWCRKHLAGAAVPRTIRFVEALPRGASGKPSATLAAELLREEPR